MPAPPEQHAAAGQTQERIGIVGAVYRAPTLGEFLYHREQVHAGGAKDAMADSTRTLLRTIDGPKGKAEIYEILEASNNDATVGGEVVNYEVIFNDQAHKARALGEASIVAEELAGTGR